MKIQKLDATGRVIEESDSSKTYELRRGRGLSQFAPVVRLHKGKPRYYKVGNLLVIVRARQKAI